LDSALRYGPKRRQGTDMNRLYPMLFTLLASLANAAPSPAALQPSMILSDFAEDDDLAGSGRESANGRVHLRGDRVPANDNNDPRRVRNLPPRARRAAFGTHGHPTNRIALTAETSVVRSSDLSSAAPGTNSLLRIQPAQWRRLAVMLAPGLTISAAALALYAFYSLLGETLIAVDPALVHLPGVSENPWLK
jgi:hypothetical protein